MRETGLLFL